MAVAPRVAQTNVHIRMVARLVGGILLVGGIVLVVIGFHKLAPVFNGDPFADDPGFAPFAYLAPGGFAIVFGLGALSAGFLGAQANYAAGETGGALRSIAEDISGGVHDGLGGVAGPFCSACGTRNDAGAHFCDACGKPLTVA